MPGLGRRLPDFALCLFAQSPGRQLARVQSAAGLQLGAGYPHCWPRVWLTLQTAEAGNLGRKRKLPPSGAGERAPPPRGAARTTTGSRSEGSGKILPTGVAGGRLRAPTRSTSRPEAAPHPNKIPLPHLCLEAGLSGKWLLHPSAHEREPSWRVHLQGDFINGSSHFCSPILMTLHLWLQGTNVCIPITCPSLSPGTAASFLLCREERRRLVVGCWGE